MADFDFEQGASAEVALSSFVRQRVMSAQLLDQPYVMPGGLTPMGQFLFINTTCVGWNSLRPGNVVLVPDQEVVVAVQDPSWADFCAIVLFGAFMVCGVANGKMTFSFLGKVGNGDLSEGWPAAGDVGTIVSFLNTPSVIVANDALVGLVPGLAAAARTHSGLLPADSAGAGRSWMDYTP